MTIFSRLSHELKARIAVEWFGSANADGADGFCDFFDYYEEELKLLRIGASENWSAAHLALRSHEDVLVVVELLRTNRNASKSRVQELIGNAIPEADPVALNHSIDLCVRLWLMLNVRDDKFQSLRPLDTCLRWAAHDSLEKLVSTEFRQRDLRELSMRDARFDVKFTAASMTAICGLRIHWTTNLHDHLLLNRRKKLLSVFAYEHQLEAVDASRVPLPDSVLEETVKSLNLLFPAWDPETERLLQHEGRPQPWWAASRFCRSATLWDSRRALNLNDFNHWQQRLLELHEEVFNAPPVTWAQLWRDRRNPHLYYTFWLAFAILLLTIGQFVTGIIQAWASLQALKQSS